MGKKNFYAVRHGRQTGIYNSWPECQAAVNGFPGAKFQGFATYAEATAYMGPPVAGRVEPQFQQQQQYQQPPPPPPPQRQQYQQQPYMQQPLQPAFAAGYPAAAAAAAGLQFAPSASSRSARAAAATSQQQRSHHPYKSEPPQQHLQQQPRREPLTQTQHRVHTNASRGVKQEEDSSDDSTAPPPYSQPPPYAAAAAAAASSSSVAAVSSSAAASAAPASAAAALPIRYGILFADGAAKANPSGPCGAGGILYEGVLPAAGGAGNSAAWELGASITCYKRYLGVRSNNEAEYSALLLGLEAALAHGVTHLTVKMDSELIVKQMCGDYKVKAANLLPLYHEALQLAMQFQQCHVQHIYRNENGEADELANEAITDALGHKSQQ